MRLVIPLLLASGFLLLGCGEPLAPLNHSPLLESQSDTTAVVNETLHLQAQATDPDGDDISFRVVVGMTWAEIHYGPRPLVLIDQTTGEFQYTPRNIGISGRTFTFVAMDNRGGQDSTSFHVAVTQ